MIRSTLISSALAAGLAWPAAAEAGPARVTRVTPEAEPAGIVIHFGMNRPDDGGFVAAAGGAPAGMSGGVSVARGPRAAAAACPAESAGLRPR